MPGLLAESSSSAGPRSRAGPAPQKGLEIWQGACRCGHRVNLIRGERSGGIRWSPLGLDLVAAARSRAATPDESPPELGDLDDVETRRVSSRLAESTGLRLRWRLESADEVALECRGDPGDQPLGWSRGDRFEPQEVAGQCEAGELAGDEVATLFVDIAAASSVLERTLGGCCCAGG